MDPSAALGLLALAALTLWRMRRWPLTDCWFCKGRGKRSRQAWFTRRRVSRPCRWCGGRGHWLRWRTPLYGGRKR